jgi:hypothetical protein
MMMSVPLVPLALAQARASVVVSTKARLNSFV